MVLTLTFSQSAREKWTDCLLEKDHALPIFVSPSSQKTLLPEKLEKSHKKKEDDN